MKDQLYYCTEDRKIYTPEALESLFEEFKRDGSEPEGMIFTDWLRDCLSKNGTLEPFDPETMENTGGEMVYKSELLEARIEDLGERIARLLSKYTGETFFDLWDEVTEAIKDGDCGELGIRLGMITYRDTSDDDMKEADTLCEELETLSADIAGVER